MDEYKFDVVALTETWKRADLGIKKQECNNWAKLPATQEAKTNYSRNSGGIYIGSDFPTINTGNLKGFTKTKINGVYFINVYFNDQGIQNKENLYKYIKSLVLNGTSFVVMGDFNDAKQETFKVLPALGLKNQKTNPTYYTWKEGQMNGH